MDMKKKFINILISLLSSIALFLPYKKIYYGQSIFSIKLVILIIIFSCIFYFIFKKDKNNLNKCDKYLCLFFSLCVLIGQSYRDISSLNILFKNFMFLFTIIRFIGIYYLIINIYSLAKKLIIIYKNDFDIKENKFIRYFNKHPFLVSFIILCIFYSIYYIAFYPAVLSPDPSNQIKQAFNVPNKYTSYSIQINPNVHITNHHPVLHTMLLGWSIKLGRLLINDNFGLFIYTFFQGLFLTLTLCYTITYLKKKNISNKYLFLILILYIIMPCFSFYLVNTNKDTIYTTLIIWLIISLVEFIDNYKNKKIPLKNIILLFIILLFICLFRNNGIFLVLMIFPFALIYSKKNRKILTILTMSLFVIYYSYTNILLPKLGVTPTSIREVLSIPFQQTARLIKYKEEDITENDKIIISKILDYDKIKKKYKPTLSDPVKGTFNIYYTKSDLKSYFKVWVKGLIYHPYLYLNATLNNIYGYFDPGDTNWYIYSKYYNKICEDNLVNYHYNNLGPLRKFLSSYAEIYRVVPVLGLFVSIGFNVWLLIIMVVYLIKNKNYKYLIVLLPMIISLLFCVVGPANTYFRYAMPIIFPMPFMVVYLLNIKNKEKNMDIIVK